MRTAAIFVLTVSLPLWTAIQAAEPSPVAGRPNIVLIMADDMGFSDIGCYGSEIATPTLDRLATNGIRFTQFYNGARCCPTRAALLTGLYAHQTGIGHMVGDAGVPSYQGYLNDHCVTIAEALHTVGYRTLMSGKWHVGEQKPHWPLDRGFDEYFGIISGAANYFGLAPARNPGARRVMLHNNEAYTPDPGKFYMTDAISEHASRMIGEVGQTKQPFFLYVAYTSPHWPLHAWPEDIAKYKGKYMDGWDALRAKRHRRMIELGIVRSDWPMTPRDEEAPDWSTVEDKEEMDLRMAVYAAQIDRMDQGIGRIMAKLQEVGAEDNTLVMFLADNGGCAEGGPLGFDRMNNDAPCGTPDSYMSYGLAWANASNTPFRRYKHWVHEGGIATPFIASWPAGIRERGKITPQVGHLIDVMATCLDVAKAPYPTRYKDQPITPLEGLSLLPIYRGETRAGHDTLFWEHEGNRAVRQGRWKLVSRLPGDWELYDLDADRTELNNLAGAHAEKVKELSALYDQWAARAGVIDWRELQRIRRPR